ncbi:phage virion morphogenesis protein [Serratia marcescens]|uniref:phage virion morphogenesis protein n=1 Tax=Serratia marcescens TaxID=615 RepID=UPI000EF2821C|nr:phage virion morphogenesis protein [Serratia marcescens]RLO25837.1 phage virion morphogenesis protein [Serratia marcescens]RLO39084.1 phage virion morphogenesis protein [Serratia marcescens]
MSDFIQIEDWLASLASQLTPAARKKLTRQWANELRRRQRLQISQQRNPDGTPYAERKPQGRSKKGRIRRKMFSKLQTTRFMKTATTADEAAVYFAGSVMRIARVHHYGLRDKVSKRGPTVKYDARELFGFSGESLKFITNILLKNIAQYKP